MTICFYIIHKYPNFLKSAYNKKVYHNYTDKISDWRDIIPDIYYISSYKMDIMKCSIRLKELKKISTKFDTF